MNHLGEAGPHVADGGVDDPVLFAVGLRVADDLDDVAGVEGEAIAGVHRFVDGQDGEHFSALVGDQRRVTADSTIRTISLILSSTRSR
jgi:hypothetical protein